MDPALLTFQEFFKGVGGDKYHPPSAYDWSLAKMNENEWDRKDHYPTFLFRRKLGGITFEFRMNKEDHYQDDKFAKRDPEGGLIYVGRELQFYTREELLQKNDPTYRRYEYSFAVFDGESKVAVAQDEWGCVLVAVAREYRQFGLGPILTKMAWEAEPGKSTGGCTPGGARVVQRVHQDFVREYLRNGTYSKLIKERAITTERVKEILKSAKLESQYVPPRVKEKMNLGMNDPRNFLLFEENGSFILYDRKLKDILESGDTERNFYWMEKAIKGASFAGGGYHSDDRLFLHQLGGDTPQIKKFMFMLALSYAKKEGVPLKIFDDDLNMVNPSEVELKEGNLAMMKGTPINWSPMKTQEAQFRRTFDRYGEFKDRIMEMAEAKYQDTGGGTTAGRLLISSCLVFGRERCLT
jgi:hypothetical protein